MQLYDYLTEVAATFDSSAPMDSSAQLLLRGAPDHLDEYSNGGLVIRGSGGQGSATFTPWIGWFDPDETDSPRSGIYVVYIFSQDLSSVVLTLNQGTEQLRKAHGVDALTLLRQDAAAIRDRLSASELEGWYGNIDLRSSGDRQRSYEAGNILSRTYHFDDLPSEQVLRVDLEHICSVYQSAIHIKRELLLESPGAIAVPGDRKTNGVQDRLTGFKPKDSTDYIATLRGRELVKSRRHEKLVKDYGEYCEDAGFEPATEHPQDLVLRRGEEILLVEVKVVYRGNATDAVRAAIGQLLTYSHFLYRHDDRPQLVALFSEAVGDAYVEFLEAHDVASVWYDLGWRGSAKAMSLGLVGS